MIKNIATKFELQILALRQPEAIDACSDADGRTTKAELGNIEAATECVRKVVMPLSLSRIAPATSVQNYAFSDALERFEVQPRTIAHHEEFWILAVFVDKS